MRMQDYRYLGVAGQLLIRGFMRALIFALLLTPSLAFADKHDDVGRAVIDASVGLTQIAIQGKDAEQFSQVQRLLLSIVRDIGQLKKEHEELKNEKACPSSSPLPEPSPS